MGEMDNKVGFMIHKLDLGVKKILDANMKAAGYDEVTLMHGWILKYLYDNRDREVYQRDIEKQFSIGRSTVTTIIQLMEKRDLVRRESVEHDARLKKVLLTEKGYQHHDLVEENIYNIHKKIMTGISEEEKILFLDIVQKMESNLKMVKAEINTSIQTAGMDLKEE
ncbi:MAG: MarR family transcriptional regulator [Lachnospiraceae bacterium]|nr:MarR family transcriptional regulator [Lachnospiraceae bacterium]